ncbi:hypothetical protein [Thalassotalea maritima]|uniref:hypothetical protein n=1 Tax=Thalassotalea maritima TaxID=3242416 RepID=UPI003529B6D4
MSKPNKPIKPVFLLLMVVALGLAYQLLVKQQSANDNDQKAPDYESKSDMTSSIDDIKTPGQLVSDFIANLPAKLTFPACKQDIECLNENQLYDELLHSLNDISEQYYLNNQGFTVMTHITQGAQYSQLSLWRFNLQGEFVERWSESLAGDAIYCVDKINHTLRIEPVDENQEPFTVRLDTLQYDDISKINCSDGEQ